MKYLVVLPLLLILSGCVQPYLVHSDNKLTINNNDQSFKIDLLNEKKHKSNYAVSKGFVLDEKTFHLEYIQLKSQYTWVGLADGLYQDFLNEKIKNIKLVSHYKVDSADIFYYTKEDKYFYLITLYDGSSNTFILDYTGDIVSKILGNAKYISKEKQLETRFTKSILDNNIYAHYFEKKNSEEDIIIP